MKTLFFTYKIKLLSRRIPANNNTEENGMRIVGNSIRVYSDIRFAINVCRKISCLFFRQPYYHPLYGFAGSVNNKTDAHIYTNSYQTVIQHERVINSYWFFTNYLPRKAIYKKLNSPSGMHRLRNHYQSPNTCYPLEPILMTIKEPKQFSFWGEQSKDCFRFQRQP